MHPPSPRHVVIIAVIIALSAVSLTARSLVPVGMGRSPLDGGLFIRQATYLAHGQWLGPFDRLTLAKGSSYPALIAITNRVGLPLMTAQQLTYLLAAGCVAACLFAATGRTLASVCGYGVLALNPVNFDGPSSAVNRDAWTAALALLFVAATFLSIFIALKGSRPYWAVPMAALAGLSGAAFWLCREESAWLLPSLAVIALGLPTLNLATRWFAVDRPRPTRRQIARAAVPAATVFALVAVTFGGPLWFVSSQNQSHYATPLTSDTANGQFSRAYGAWMRVRVGAPSFRVPIDAAQRSAVYAVSPAALELRPYLEAPADRWIRLGCSSTPCDLAGAFTEWALRDATANAGHLSTEAAAQEFFGQLADQIGTACAERRLRCRPALPPALEVLELVTPDQVIGSIGNQLRAALASRDYYMPGTTQPPTLPAPYRAKARAMVPALPTTDTDAARQARLFRSHDRPYRLLGMLYWLLTPALLAIGLAAGAYRASRRRRLPGPLSVLTLALVVGVLTRLVVLALVDTSEFTVSSGRYGLPTVHFLITVAVVSAVPVVARLIAARRPGGSAQ